MSQHIVMATPLGTLQEATTAFQTTRAPYVRGGGDSLSAKLEQELNHAITGGQATSVTLTSNGQSANVLALQSILPLGTKKKLAASSRTFGTTLSAINEIFARAGHEVAFFDPNKPETYAAAIQGASAVFTETTSNPEGIVADLALIKEMARRNNAVIVLDHTLSAGFRDFEIFKYADIATISLTKQTGGGNNSVTGGAVFTGSHEFWQGAMANDYPIKDWFSGKLPDNNFGNVLRKMGTINGTCTIPAGDAQSLLESLPNLQERVQTQRDNAKALATFLNDHPHVTSVRLGGLDNTPNSMRAQQFLGGNGFVILFDINTPVADFADKIQQGGISHSVQLGQKQTAIAVPGVSTNRQSSEDALAKRGMSRESIRVSVGTEAPRKLIKAFGAALG